MSHKILYRYRERVHYWEDIGKQVVIECDEYPVIEETEKGYWILTGSSFWLRDKWKGKIPKKYKKFVLKCGAQGKKRYAYEDKQRAFGSYKRRKQAQIDITKEQLATAEQALRLIERGEFSTKTKQRPPRNQKASEGITCLQ